MRLAIYMNKDKNSHWLLAKALAEGIDAEVNFNPDDLSEEYDLAALSGVKDQDRIRDLQARGLPFLYFDKGYNRIWSSKNPEWWRVAISAHQPTRYLDRLGFPGDRAALQGWECKPQRKDGRHILFAGSSEKYCRLYGIGCPTAYAAGIVKRLKELTDREIWYRPKPSWGQAVAVEGAKFITPKGRYPIESDLLGAHALVTHGSNACFDALIAGIPAIILGNGVTAGISSQTLEEINAPQLSTDAERNKLLANLGYCQWSLDEIRSGKMWKSYHSIMQNVIPSFMR